MLRNENGGHVENSGLHVAMTLWFNMEIEYDTMTRLSAAIWRFSDDEEIISSINREASICIGVPVRFFRISGRIARRYQAFGW